MEGINVREITEQSDIQISERRKKCNSGANGARFKSQDALEKGFFNLKCFYDV